jgi:hypothetical protein
MKRISLLSISVSLILCTSIQARNDAYVPVRNRIQWSPYQQGLVSGMVSYTPYSFKYGSTGLICNFVEYSPYDLKYGGDGLVYDTLEYSPYALKYGGSGMVEHNAYYSPYAFGYNKSGLISDYTESHCCGSYTSDSRKNNNMYGICQNSCAGTDLSQSFSSYMKEVSANQAAARNAILEERKAAAEKNKQLKANDPSEAIRQILKSNNINFNISRNLCIEGKTISVNFDIKDANIIIKFWNTKEISEFLNIDEHKEMIFNNYIKSWQDYCLNNIDDNTKIFNIYEGDKEGVFKQFAASDNSNNNDVMYALESKKSSVHINN